MPAQPSQFAKGQLFFGLMLVFGVFFLFKDGSSVGPATRTVNYGMFAIGSIGSIICFVLNRKK